MSQVQIITAESVILIQSWPQLILDWKREEPEREIDAVASCLSSWYSGDKGLEEALAGMAGNKPTASDGARRREISSHQQSTDRLVWLLILSVSHTSARAPLHPGCLAKTPPR